MSKRILHVSLHPDRKPPVRESLLSVLDRAPDWVEYAPNRWLLWTSLDPGTWYRRFRKSVGPEDTLLVFPADLSEYEGYLPTAVWDWLQKYRPLVHETESQAG